MKLIWGISTVILIVCAGAAYYFLLYDPPAKYRPVNTPPPPPEYTSLSGITLVHPEATSTRVTLDIVFATGQANFPAGRYILETASSTVIGRMIAFDRYAHEGDDGLFAVPIGVTDEKTGIITYYLGLLEGENKTHVASLPIGEDIDIEKVLRDGDLVTFKYRAHAREQQRTENPRLATEAVVDIKARALVKEGANVALANEVEIKRIPGALYQWQDTLTADGAIVEPISDAFTITFERNLITVATDCNTGTASYSIDEQNVITLETLSTTKRFCSSEQENVFFDMVRGVTGYQYNAGQLTLTGEDEIRLYNPEIITTPDLQATSSSSTSTQE